MAEKKKTGEVEYFAGGRLQVNRDGELVTLGRGDPVPEAAQFPKLRAHLKVGTVIGLIDGEPIRRSRHHIGRIRHSARYVRARHLMEIGAAGRARDAVKAGAGGSKRKASSSGGGADNANKAAGDSSNATKKKATKKKAASKGKTRTRKGSGK